ncbi:hypothetical protein EMCRGX_G034929 [Ephydatia muelleri]
MLVAEKGIMSSPNPKSGRTLPAHTEEEITDFYLSDDISRVMPAQYKNCKNFTNLCYHVDDFGVQVEWHFFATSHGKSAGDCAGGTLKRLVSRASLQHLYSNHIFTAKQLYEFAVSGYVTVVYDGSCWLGCVLSVNPEDHNVTVTFLHPRIPAASFLCPHREDILEVDPFDILSIVQPSTTTGRRYDLTRKEMQEATSALESYLLCMLTG